ncbi:MAG: carboxypeptidase regulatory-like domain-containing protein [PVC group bacterium]
MNKYYFYGIACLLCWLLIPVTVLSGPVPTPTPSPKAGSPPVPGTIRVSVLSNLEKPVSGARVSIFGLKGPDGEELSPCGGYEEIELEADSETLFEKDLPPGPYRVEAYADGWIGQVIGQVELKEGEVRELDIKLQPGQRIAGRVEDGDGGPLAGVEITYWSSGMDTGPFLYSVKRKFITDSDGWFDLKGLQEGVYTVTASLAGYVKDTRNDVVTGMDNLLMVLRKGFVIKGLLRGDLEGLGSPVRLDFKKGKWNFFSRSVDLDPESNFSVSDLEEDSYNLRVRHGDYISDWAVNIPASPAARAVSIALTVYRGAGISGRVVDEKTKLPLEDAHITLSPRNKTSRESHSTGKEGAFEFKALTEGDYRLTARLWHDPYNKKRAEKEISLAPGEKVTGIQLELNPGRRVTLSGMVVDEEGRSVSEAEIREYCRPPGEERFQSNDRSDVHSDETGAFSVDVFLPGEAEIKLAARKEGYAQSKAEIVPLSSGSDTMEGIVLQINTGGSLAVEVKDEEGSSVVGAVVSLKTDWSPRKETRIWFPEQKKLSDSRGRCLFDHLPAADFRIRVSKEGYSPGSEKFTLPEDEASADVTVTIQKGRNLQVTVKNTRGGAVEGAAVSFREPSRGFTIVTSSLDGDIRTDSRGIAVLRDLPPRAVLVSVNAEGYSETRRQQVEADQDTVEVILNDAGSIRGRFLTTGKKPVAEVRIIPRKRKADPFDFQSIFWSGSRPVELGEGSFRIDGIIPGTYDLTVTSPGLAAGKIEGVEVEAGEETDLGDVVLRPEGTITGTVVDSLTGVPLERFWVRVKGEGLRSPSTYSHRGEAGGYTLEGLDAGEYTLIVNSKDYKQKEIPGILLSAGEEKKIPRVELERMTPKEKEERDREQHTIPSLGVRIKEVEGEVFPDALPIAEVLAGSAAEKGGLRAGDAIKKVNGKTFLEDPGGFLNGLLGKPGTTAKITVVRGETGKEEEVEITIGDWDFEEFLKKAME